MTLDKAFDAFAVLLQERFASGVLTTEDSVRYTFYAALTQTCGLRHTDIVLEYPHPAKALKKVDTVVMATARQPSMAFEFKYDRRMEQGTTMNRTQRAGKLFEDIFRLAALPANSAELKYLVYVTDIVMAHYFRREQNRFDHVFELAAGTYIDLHERYFDGYRKSMTAIIAEVACACRVSLFFSRELPGNHFIRVYKVT